MCCLKMLMLGAGWVLILWLKLIWKCEPLSTHKHNWLSQETMITIWYDQSSSKFDFCFHLCLNNYHFFAFNLFSLIWMSKRKHCGKWVSRKTKVTLHESICLATFIFRHSIIVHFFLKKKNTLIIIDKVINIFLKKLKI